MHFDWTVNVGSVVSVAALLIGLVTAHRQNSRRLDDARTQVDLRLAHIETQLKVLYDWMREAWRHD